MPNGLPALKPLKGINADTLFIGKTRNTNDRFDRVEDAVVDLRREFEVLKPSIVRLAAVETDIQSLIKELEVLLQDAPASSAPVPLSRNQYEQTPTLKVEQLNPSPRPPPELKTTPISKKQKKPPTRPIAKTFSGTAALNFRIGEHTNKVRVAFDTNNKIPFDIDLDNEEKLIIIELPNARWEGKKSQAFKHSKLLESLSIEPLNDNNGSLLVLSLRKQAQIVQEKILSPDKTSPYYRVYFDLTL